MHCCCHHYRFGESNDNDSDFENAIESLASNENFTEAIDELRNLVNADLSTLSNRELCRLFRFLSCYFCRR
jgi:hypothetical protein